MKSRPIIFSSAGNIKKILSGEKTQTRRVIKPQPYFVEYPEDFRDPGDPDGFLAWQRSKKNFEAGLSSIEFHCRYGRPGDKLWVKEAYLPDPPQDGFWDYYEYYDGVNHSLDKIPPEYQSPEYCIYKASFKDDIRWLSPIFMPRWASRIELLIRNVRVHRIQDIHWINCLAEGVEYCGSGNHDAEACIVESFIHLWDSINAKHGFSWDSNPWVWAIEFEKIERGREELRPDFGKTRSGADIEHMDDEEFVNMLTDEMTEVLKRLHRN